MADMRKIRFLSQDEKGFKLRRAVPKHLQKLASKTAIVQRVQSLKQIDIRREANIFAAQTDAYLADLAAKHDRSALEPSSVPGLTVTQMHTQLAVNYYRLELVERRKHLGGYLAGYRSVLLDDLVAGVDHEIGDLQNELSGELDIKLSAPPWALPAKVLEGIGVDVTALTNDQTTASRTYHNSPSLMALRNDLLELELSDLQTRYKALETGQLTPRSSPERGPDAHVKPLASRSLDQLIEKFLELKRQEVGPSRFNQFNVPLDALREVVGGHVSIEHISRDDIRDVCKLLIKVPSHARKKFPGMSLQ
jgi:hypothetical protein